MRKENKSMLYTHYLYRILICGACVCLIASAIQSCIYHINAYMILVFYSAFSFCFAMIKTFKLFNLIGFFKLARFLGSVAILEANHCMYFIWINFFFYFYSFYSFPSQHIFKSHKNQYLKLRKRRRTNMHNFTMYSYTIILWNSSNLSRWRFFLVQDKNLFLLLNA